MELVDTHCHPHFENYGLDAVQTLKDAAAAGVTRLICVGTTVNDSVRARRFAEEHPNVWATAGAHPHEASRFAAQLESNLAELAELATSPKVVAIGETGLDYFRRRSSPEAQKKVLYAQIGLGRQLGKPMVFHVRDAWDDFWPIFDQFDGVRGVVHSFSAHPEHLKPILARGLYVGLNGIMTFTQDKRQLAAARQIPLGSLLLETDAPFLTPVPFRGKICEPKHARVVAEFLADLRGENIEELAAATTKNARELFGLN